jgi:hypothetical protein
MTEENKNEQEVDDDFGKCLSELLGSLSKAIEEDPIETESEFKYPMEISGIKTRQLKNINRKKTGSLVQIRPCGDEYKKKTYLGIYIGEVPIELIVGLHKNTNELDIMDITNPAIFVPDLKKVIFGCESWWGYIETEEELMQIADDDIDKIWYVQLLKEMGKKNDGMGTGTEDNKISE